MEGKNDLNSKSAKPMLPQPVRKELTNEWQQIGLFSIDGLPLLVPVSGMRRTLSWRLQTQELLLLGSVSLHGLCPADVSRKPARYRSLSACQSNQALSHGYSGPHFAQHLGPRQLGARLAHLRRLCSLADPTSTSALPGRRVRPSPATDCLRPRCHHYRSLPFTVSLGLLSQTQRGSETAYAARPAWQYSYGNHYYSWPDPRGQHSRSTNFRTRRFLCYGSCLPRFSACIDCICRPLSLSPAPANASLAGGSIRSQSIAPPGSSAIRLSCSSIQCRARVIPTSYAAFVTSTAPRTSVWSFLPTTSRCHH